MSTLPKPREHRSGTSLRRPERLALPRHLTGPVGELVQRCPAIGRIHARARGGKPLTAEEVHVVIQTFAGLGEDGWLFVHQLLGTDRGYDPDLVNRTLGAVSPQPIGCAKIRSRLRRDGAPDLCHCVFKLPPESYAAPVVHLDRFPPAPGKVQRSGEQPPDLDGDGRRHGYLSRAAKAAAALLGLNRE